MPIKGVMVALFTTTNNHFYNAFDTFYIIIIIIIIIIILIIIISITQNIEHVIIVLFKNKIMFRHAYY